MALLLVRETSEPLLVGDAIFWPLARTAAVVACEACVFDSSAFGCSTTLVFVHPRVAAEEAGAVDISGFGYSTNFLLVHPKDAAALAAPSLSLRPEEG